MRLLLFNSLDPNGKGVTVTVTVEKPDLVESNDGEVGYILGLHTRVIGLDGNPVEPVFIHHVNLSNLQAEIKKGLATLGEKIDWGTLQNDVYPPRVNYTKPYNKEQNVLLNSEVVVSLRDPFPGSLINTSTLRMYANNIDITDKINFVIKENNVIVKWRPKVIK